MKRKFLLVLPCILSGLFFSSCGSRIPQTAESPVTGGLRSGDQAINRDNIDPILNSPSKEKQDRPGLATSWGDEKTSYIEEHDFTRASSKPAGIDSIFYNNPDGVKAMSSYAASANPLQTAAGGLIEWGIKGSSGFLPAYKEYGYSRRLVTGKNGGSYSIFVRNRSKSPLEIVASVDGLDIQDGKTASFSKRGYIVPAGKSVTFDGFRTSSSTVAAFKFSSVSNSYANLRHGETRNVGVIGLAVFTQKGVDPWTWMPSEVKSRGSARAFAEAP